MTPAQKGSTIADGRKRLVHAQAARAELRVAREAGLLVSARAVEERWSAMVVEARNALLGLPSRFKARRPGATREDMAALDGLIREVLEGLADGRKDGLDKSEGKPA